jgi:hypothetical protein
LIAGLSIMPFSTSVTGESADIASTSPAITSARDAAGQRDKRTGGDDRLRAFGPERLRAVRSLRLTHQLPGNVTAAI